MVTVPVLAVRFRFAVSVAPALNSIRLVALTGLPLTLRLWPALSDTSCKAPCRLALRSVRSCVAASAMRLPAVSVVPAPSERSCAARSMVPFTLRLRLDGALSVVPACRLIRLLAETVVVPVTDSALPADSTTSFGFVLAV